jgi:hypothetical protein
VPESYVGFSNEAILCESGAASFLLDTLKPITIMAKTKSARRMMITSIAREMLPESDELESVPVPAPVTTDAVLGLTVTMATLGA